MRRALGIPYFECCLMVLEPARKRFLDGAHRLLSPEQTLERISSDLRSMGITRIANVTGLDTIGLPVVAVVRPNSRSLAVAQGKGVSLAAAKASGLMEAIESFHAENVNLPLRLASLEELQAGQPVVRVEGLPRLSVSVFHVAKRILWCLGRELSSGEELWVPYEMIHTDYTLPLPAGSGSFLMSSNGLASGNHRLEAVSHAICELIERDAIALWSLGGGIERLDCRLDLGSVDDPLCRSVLDLLHRAGIAVAVWDITSDIGIASFACFIADRQLGFLGQLYASHGSGCHPTREIALMRALTEAAQCRLTFIAGARDDGDRDFFARARNPDRVARVRSAIDKEPEVVGRDFREVPSRCYATFDEDVAWELEQLAAAGVDQVVEVDLSRPEHSIPVTRVVAPGLEGLFDAPGYVPGRRARRLLIQGRA